MTRSRPLPLLAALLLPALAACAPPSGDASAPSGLFGPRDAGPPQPEPLPPNVLAALPPGVPSSVVLQDGQGCYLYSIERTDPPSGYPLRDAQGNQVCEGGAVPAAAPVLVAGLAADVSASVPLEDPAPVAQEGPIDITPVLTAPLPPADPASDALPSDAPPPDAPPLDAPPLDAPPAIPPAIVPGDITPPAPLAPLN